jgi:hypothetical protein
LPISAPGRKLVRASGEDLVGSLTMTLLGGKKSQHRVVVGQVRATAIVCNRAVTSTSCSS